MTAVTVRDEQVLSSFELAMMTAKFSPKTIKARLEVVHRFAARLSAGLLEATPEDLVAFQEEFATLSRASIDLYTRHLQAFYRWTVAAGLVTSDPTGRMVRVRVRRGIPHPITDGDLRMLLACAPHPLRTVYILAAFVGLRTGEITRLRGEDLRMDDAQPTALIQGKGDKERIVPLLAPVVDELRRLGFPERSGPVVTYIRADGRKHTYTPERLSNVSHYFMRSVGVQSTLHSLRHYFASEVARLTKDLLLVRDLLGHESVATTQIYTASSFEGVQDRLASFASTATGMITNKAGEPMTTTTEPAPAQQSEVSDLLTAAQVAQRLGLSYAEFIDRHNTPGAVPAHVHVEGEVRYTFTDLGDWFAGRSGFESCEQCAGEIASWGV